MNNQNTEAIEALSLFDIRIRSEFAELRDNYFPPYSGPKEMVQQTVLKPFSRGFGEINAIDETTGLEKKFDAAHFLVQCGLRFLEKDAIVDGSPLPDSDIKQFILADFRCTFVAVYLLNKPKENVSDQCLDRFLKENVSFNIWPYWRHWAQTKAQEYHLPKVMLGLYKIPN